MRNGDAVADMSFVPLQLLTKALSEPQVKARQRSGVLEQLVFLSAADHPSEQRRYP